jgi:hypothetical protein
VAESMGHSWVSLQHVGVVIGLRTGTLPQTFANTLTTYISNTLGYHQRVEVKDMIPGGPPIQLWEWNNDKKHVCKTITENLRPASPHTQAFREWLQAVNPHRTRCAQFSPSLLDSPSLPELAIHGLRACIHPYLYTFLHNHSRTIDKHR